MKHLMITTAALLAAAPAQAHIGHIGEVAGHGHWIGIGAIGLAIFIGLLGAKKGKDQAEDPDKTEEEDETEEQPA